MFPVLNARNIPSAQGQSAALNGSALEMRVAKFLTGYGYTKQQQADFNCQHPYFIPQFKMQGRFLSIYGNPQKIDFFIFNPEIYQRGLLVECKNQRINGSVDMKLPYTVLSLKQTGVPSILLLDGEGFTPRAIDWCMAQQDEQFMCFHGFNTFQRAAEKGLL